MTEWTRLPLLIFSGCLLMLAACGSDGPADEEGDSSREGPRPAAALLQERDDPQPINLPEDAAPHDRLTEWWYYTGHLEDGEGNQYGFQFVIFQVLRGEFPPTYAAHFAVTDVDAGTFQYDQRVQTGGPGTGERPVDLSVGDWTLTGGDGTDQITASLPDYQLDLALKSEKPPVLHEGDGFFEFAPAAASYYYSRTRMSAEGTLTVDGEPLEVTGDAWFDQQWGDFLVTDDAGWDWFSIQLDNGEEVMAWQSHDGEGAVLDGNATLVDETGEVTDVPYEDLEIRPLDQWQSPESSAVYPSGWEISIPSEKVDLEVLPVLDDQELNTVESTGVIYWEGLVSVSGEVKEEDASGFGYVELTGYADAPSAPMLDTDEPTT